ncbi:MAG TPA: type I-B CRISPR-associated protein Cas7/Csh2, partial [Thermodesulfobium narugense]|nr:type I-B CRISPR-associated protein Cas7/Csh2 [Thermodesulfobium narugense]
MSEKQILKNRHEFLFGHDVKWANPNGDPLDENRPRLDDETSILLVRDARIKRTIRDTIEEFYKGNGREIFIRKDYKPDGKPKTKTDIVAEAKQEIDKDKDSGSFLSKLLDKFIDIRLFGATFALPKDKDSKGSGKGKQQNKDQESSQEEKQEESDLNNNESLVGPVQFQFGRSIHRVTIEKIQGTSIMPSEGGKAQGTFTEGYVVPYAFILFYGIANEKAAEDTHLTDEDLSLMFEAMWLGYKAGTDVLSGSKLGHAPRILIDIVYKPGIMAHIGDLDSCIRHNPRPGLEDEA